MFEKWRIKEHMDVRDSAGRSVGKVDKVDGDMIVLTRSDSADNRHHEINLDYVDHIREGHVELKQGTPIPEGLITADYSDGVRPGVQPASAKTDGYAGNVTTAAPNPASTNDTSQIFGTSGLGTGMGGSGTPST